MLVVTGLRVRTAINSLEAPFGFLEPHSILLVLFRVCLLFALPLVGRCVVAALLFQLFAVLFCELLDLPALLDAVACGVVHWTMRPSVIAVGRLSPQGPQPPPATAAATTVVGAPTSGWLLPPAFIFFCFLLPPPWAAALALGMAPFPSFRVGW
jgi:hypothetical protein